MNILHVGADSAWPIRAAAAILLAAHIAGGIVGLLSGGAALALRKGGRLHGLAGTGFFAAMLVMTWIGATVSPFLVARNGDPKAFDSIAGFFTFYLVATGWVTVRRKAGTVGRAEAAGFLFAALLAAATLLVGAKAAFGATGRFGGHAAVDYCVLGTFIAFAAACDAKVLRNGGIAGAPRIARHAWRMSMALFSAAISFFLGQQRVMPALVQGSPLLFIPPLATLATMLFWLLRLRFAKVPALGARRPTRPA